MRYKKGLNLYIFSKCTQYLLHERALHLIATVKFTCCSYYKIDNASKQLVGIYARGYPVRQWASAGSKKERPCSD